MKVEHLTNKSINRLKWDECIAQSLNEVPYAYSWYLDVVSPGWEALMSNDYNYVMPLPAKRKFKITYLVQPVLTQQLGIFSPSILDENVVDLFVKQIPYYSYELNLNEQNHCKKAIKHPNYKLNLNLSYNELLAQYSKNTIRNIEKARKAKLTVHSHLNIEPFLEFYYSVERSFMSVHPTTLRALLNRGVSEKKMKLYTVFSESGVMIAALCLLHSERSMTYLLPVSSKEGKSNSAMFLLIDSIIQECCNQKKAFDFEGSKIDGIARFYKGFGAKNHPYYIIKKFRPAFLIKKLSKQ